MPALLAPSAAFLFALVQSPSPSAAPSTPPSPGETSADAGRTWTTAFDGIYTPRAVR